MNKILNNKQMLHIITETIVISGITLYFSNKNKKITSHLEDISSRVDELEDLLSKKDEKIAVLIRKIEKQEETLKELQKSINNINSVIKVQKNTTPMSNSKTKILPEKYSPKINYLTDDVLHFQNKSKSKDVNTNELPDIPEEFLDKELFSELADLEENTTENKEVDLLDSSDSTESTDDKEEPLEEEEEIEEISSKTHLKKKN